MKLLERSHLLGRDCISPDGVMPGRYCDRIKCFIEISSRR
jgi:hypothetical protein